MSLAFDRDDIHWGIQIADYQNAHLPDGEFPRRPIDVMPYVDPMEEFDEDITQEELLARIGFGTHGKVTRS